MCIVYCKRGMVFFFFHSEKQHIRKFNVVIDLMSTLKKNERKNLNLRFFISFHRIGIIQIAATVQFEPFNILSIFN